MNAQNERSISSLPPVDVESAVSTYSRLGESIGQMFTESLIFDDQNEDREQVPDRTDPPPVSDETYDWTDVVAVFLLIITAVLIVTVTVVNVYRLVVMFW